MFFKRARGQPVPPRRQLDRADLRPFADLPGAASPAMFRGGEQFEQLGDWVVFTWDTPLGILAVVHPSDAASGGCGEWVREFRPDIRFLLQVSGVEDICGPELVDLARRDKYDHYEKVHWRALVRVLGQPIPYWPHHARHPELMVSWRPDTRRQVVPANLEIDCTALLQLAAHFPEDSVLRRLLLLNYQSYLYSMSRTSREFASWISGEAEFDDADQSHMHRHNLTPEHITIAAVAKQVAKPPTPVEAGITEYAERAAWLSLLDADDVLSERVVRLLSGVLNKFPFGFHVEISSSHGECAREWIAKLTETQLPRGMQGYFAPSREYRPITGYFTEPVTGAPVTRYQDTFDGEVYVTVRPKNLATVSPLKELVLEEEAWIRTADGELHLCPSANDKPSWGYYGTGQGMLVATIARLLDDISAPGVGNSELVDQPKGLDTLFGTATKEGRHTFSRQQLEQARKR